MAQPMWKGRLFAEGVVIVVSILLAFAIDAGWTEHLERLEEAKIRLGLREEFQEYRGSLASGIDQHGRMLAAMGLILESVEAGEWASREMTIDQAIGLAMQPPTSDLGNGVRDALVQAGRLEMISDPVLRRRLAEWPRFFEELLDDQVFGRRIVTEEIFPYMASMGLPLGAIMAALNDGPWPVTEVRIADSTELLQELLRDQHFRALMEIRYGFWAHTGGEYEDAIRAVDAILSDLSPVRD